MEDFMWKALLAGTTALTIVGAAVALAQPGGGFAHRWQPSAEDLAAFSDARIAALKAGLRLTTEQEKHWPAVENALRERAKLRAERITEFRDRQRLPDAAQRERNVVERLRRRADVMTTEAATLKRLVEAVEPLYQSLDDNQKQRFALLFREGGAHHFGFGRHHMGPGHMGPGYWQRRSELAPEPGQPSEPRN